MPIRRVFVRPRRVVVVLPLMGRRISLLSNVNGTVTANDDNAVVTSTAAPGGELLLSISLSNGKHRRVVTVVCGEQEDSGAVELHEGEYELDVRDVVVFVVFGRLTHAINSSSSSKTTIAR